MLNVTVVGIKVYFSVRLKVLLVLKTPRDRLGHVPFFTSSFWTFSDFLR